MKITLSVHSLNSVVNSVIASVLNPSDLLWIKPSKEDTVDENTMELSNHLIPNIAIAILDFSVLLLEKISLFIFFA